jgi:hypothetical protein
MTSGQNALSPVRNNHTMEDNVAIGCGMTWLRRILLAMPFAMATVLTVLISSSDRFHLRPERIQSQVAVAE